MKKFLPLTAWFLLLFAALLGCEKDPAAPAVVGTPPPPPPAAPSGGSPTPPPAAPPSAGSAPYSGTWTGTATVRDSFPDFCSFVDKSLELTLQCTVLGDSVHIAESLTIDADTYPYYWRGTIKNDTLEMVSRRSVSCFGEQKLREMVIKAPVRSLPDKYQVQATTVYSMCPPDCLFIFTYELSKAK